MSEREELEAAISGDVIEAAPDGREHIEVTAPSGRSGAGSDVLAKRGTDPDKSLSLAIERIGNFSAHLDEGGGYNHENVFEMVRHSEQVISALFELERAARNPSEDTQRSEASQPALPGELVEAVRELEPYLDRLLCYASTTSEHEPNRVVKRLRAALSSLPEPLPTVESVKAERDRELIEIFAAKSQEIDQSDANGRALALSYINAVQCLRSLTEGEG